MHSADLNLYSRDKVRQINRLVPANARALTACRYGPHSTSTTILYMPTVTHQSTQHMGEAYLNARVPGRRVHNTYV